MFTGIIRNFGKVVLNYQGDLIIQCNQTQEINESQIGDSVCVNGICLTITKIEKNAKFINLYFYVMQETINCTSINKWQIGDNVNIELGMLSSQRLDGHVITGHVTHIAKCINILNTKDMSKIFIFEVQSNSQGIVKKGSICIDGVSLTVATVCDNTFSVCIIPHTLENTIFKYYYINSVVNIEVDNKTNLQCNEWDPVLTHEQGMTIAMQEALKGRYSAPPNPWVGCVIVNNDTRQIISRGYHHTPGTPHAEVHALNDFDTKYSMSNRYTMYVTLEPCSHYGRTPPCVERILKYSGIITDIYIGTLDPDTRVQGSGYKLLSEYFKMHMITNDKVKSMYKGYILNRTQSRPYIIYKIATTFDHNIKTTEKYITCSEALKDVHMLRNACDAIITTTQTVRYDSPSLNVRDSYGKEINKKPVYILGTSSVDTTCIKSDKIILVNTIDDLIKTANLNGHFECIVEGGISVYKSLVQANMIDEIVHYYTSNIDGCLKWIPDIDIVPISSEVIGTTIKTVYRPRLVESRVYTVRS